MRRVALLLIVFLTLPPGWIAADACGDKFLLVGRGAKFQRAYAAIYPGNILIYAHPRTGATAAIRDPQLQKNLKQAGHRVAMIEDAGLLEQALRSGGFDLVLADVLEAPTLDARVNESPSRPTPLYVMYEPDKAHAAALQKQYNCSLKASDKPNHYLSVIEDAMKARVVTGRRAQKN
jgi:hypothetical protein